MLDLYGEITDLLARGETVVLATVVASRGSAPRKAGAKMVMRRDGSSLGTVGGGVVEKRVCEEAARMMNTGQLRLARFELSGRESEVDAVCGGEVEVLLESLLPPETLIIAGVGHVGQAVAVTGKRLGFRIVTIDPRPDFNNAARLPDADVRVVEDYVPGLGKAAISESSYVVICTPGHVSDAGCLEIAVQSEARYVGMVGSRRKVKEVKERLLARGVPADRLERVHAPIGLAIGAETPEEIAISILAEIVKIRRSR